MIVRIGDYVLARGSAYRESPIGLSHTFTSQVEAVVIPRSPDQRLFGRGNLIGTINFGVCRLHPTLEEAQEFALLHAAQLQGITGDIVFETESVPSKTITGRGQIQTVQFTTGGLHRGISTFAQYTLLCGRMVSGPAGGTESLLQTEDGQFLRTEDGVTIQIEA